MLKRISALLIASAALVGFLEDPAHAVYGKWDTFEKWIVQADTDAAACEALSSYDNGFTLSLMNFGDEWAFGIIGYDVIPGETYATKFEFSTGDEFTGHMSALTSTHLLIKIDAEFIGAAAKSFWIEIDDQLKFELDGSAQAIKSAIECQDMLASVASLPEPSAIEPSADAPTFKWGL